MKCLKGVHTNILRKPNETQETTNTQFKEMRESIDDMNEKFLEEMDIIKEEPIKFWRGLVLPGG